MTLVATWCNYENADAPSLWVASDSRISEGESLLIDEGIKVYEVPVVCRVPGPDGFFDQTALATSIGIAGAGSSLVFQHVAGSLIPMLGNLVSSRPGVPSVADLANLVGRVTTVYVRSLGSRRPAGARITMIVAGESFAGEAEAYRLFPQVGIDGLVEFPPERLALGHGIVHFIGDRIGEAEARLSEIAARDEPGASCNRAALNVIRGLIDDPDAPSIGGDVQIGFTAGGRFRRVASVTPVPGGAPQAQRKLNSVDLDGLGSVGPWTLGIDGMVSP